jgi:hypothetical protein
MGGLVESAFRQKPIMPPTLVGGFWQGQKKNWQSPKS